MKVHNNQNNPLLTAQAIEEAAVRAAQRKEENLARTRAMDETLELQQKVDATQGDKEQQKHKKDGEPKGFREILYRKDGSIQIDGPTSTDVPPPPPGHKGIDLKI